MDTTIKKIFIETAVHLIALALMMLIYSVISIFVFNIYDPKFGDKWDNLLTDIQIISFFMLPIVIIHLVVISILKPYAIVGMVYQRPVITAFIFISLSILSLELNMLNASIYTYLAFGIISSLLLSAPKKFRRQKDNK